MTINKKIISLFTEGLIAGYAGGKPQEVHRGGFLGKSSHKKSPDGSLYHDEWFAINSGGGQELIKIDDLQYTRLYGGGTPDKKTLASLGITDIEVGAYLKKKILECGTHTRFLENCLPKAEEEWHYSYIITGQYPDTQITTALETITYKNRVVHHHAFILCPMR